MSDGTVFGVDTGLFISETALAITALAALVGIWVDRDPERPLRYSVWLTVLAVLATAVGMFQTYDDHLSEEKLNGDIARVVQKVDKIAHQSDADVPALNEVLKNEVAEQQKKNPKVVGYIAQRVADEGGNPQEVFETYLDQNDVKAIVAAGRLKTAPVDSTIASADGIETATPRRPVTFGSGKATLRSNAKPAETAKEKQP